MDAETQQPIVGAKVFWKEKPSVSAVSDATGAFDLRPSAASGKAGLSTVAEGTSLLVIRPGHQTETLAASLFLTSYNPRRSVYLR